ncbi:CaiB/BaiF CoA-transferase family protein [Mesorhizobium sp. M2C.T.Ca.TU.002.02.1.1]|uniref:CaiB/BaiF CoA transferase family protein n=1 Tax=Mesorhizobium sp. M2C.T.Ca.TU.002.02.1.1 TaxID=2496788 RepID=UPI000FCBF798|nr:CaiB/BaiF CoA-transferase family protein [Mesorhizobium sp. M2C.T.Ca.TU.002.02.1.1]RUU60128.1 CoA transferase [Mesorhizobium sp. M2C.T.Ca.TU.002.02.1.1]RUU67203.1 CoA transferase [Mesorhizobium sp. M2C.T.Ca.TU.009.01.2.1]
MSDAARPLEGLFVVSIEQAVAAPLCTVRLADAGARVVKIERPEGETARHYDSTVEGMSAYFVWLNRGKQSVALDLKAEKDLALLHRMVAQADVLVQNLAPGAIDRLGLSATVIGEKFPRLIAVNIVGYGQDTPYASMRAYDMLVQAESGICAVTGTAETPCKIGVSAADIATGMNAHAAILEALLARGRTGRGRAIEIAMFDGMADWMAVPLLHYEHTGRETGRYGLAHASIYPYRPYACCDGAAVVVSVQQNSEWKRFCSAVLRRPDLANDQRFATNAQRVANREALDAEVEPIFAAIDSNEAIGRLDQAQNAWGRVSEVRDLPLHKALRRIEVALPGGKRVTVPKPSVRSAAFETPPTVPGLGADTDRIRAEFET